MLAFLAPEIIIVKVILIGSNKLSLAPLTKHSSWYKILLHGHRTWSSQSGRGQTSFWRCFSNGSSDGLFGYVLFTLCMLAGEAISGSG